jgi:hypothetical protein
MPSDRFLDRFFFHIERFAHAHSFMVIFISVLAAGLSVWITAENLTFKNNRGDLPPGVRRFRWSDLGG